MHGYDDITKKRGDLIFGIMRDNGFKKIFGDYPDTLIFQRNKH